MNHLVKTLVVLFATAGLLTSDSTLSSRAEVSPMVPGCKVQGPESWNSAKRLSTSSFVCASTTQMPRYLAFPNWESTACIPAKP